MENYYGKDLDPTRNNRIRGGLKSERHIIINTTTPSEILPDQTLNVRFPNLGVNDVIVPNSACLVFDLTINGDNSIPVNNVRANIVKKIEVTIEGNVIFTLDDSNILYSYMDLWKPESIKEYEKYYYGIDNDENMLKLRFDKTIGDSSSVTEADKTVAKVYKNTFHYPLDFELLSTVMPFYQSGLGEKLSYLITFNSNNKFIKNSGSYEVKNIRLRFEKVNSLSLANEIKTTYNNDFSIMFDRILRHRIIPVKSTDPTWNLSFASPVKSLRGILLIGKKDGEIDPDKYWNMSIKKINITVEGIPNQLYARGLMESDIYDEVHRFLGGYYKKSRAVDNMVKELRLTDITAKEFYNDKFAVWLDFRSTQDNYLHGSGRRAVNNSEGFSIAIERNVDTESYGAKIYCYIFMDGLLQIQNSAFNSVQW